MVFTMLITEMLEIIVMSILVALLLVYFVTKGNEAMGAVMILGIVIGFFLEGKYLHFDRLFSFFR